MRGHRTKVLQRGADVVEVAPAYDHAPAMPRRISSSSRLVSPPASGVPVPGAWAGG